MAIIYSYPVASAVEAGDLVIGTDITGKQTKNFTLQSIVDLVELPDNINGTVGTIPVFTGTKAIGDSWIIQTLNPSVSSGKLVYVEGSLGVDASATVAEFFEVGGSANILGSLTVGVNPFQNMPNSHLKAPALTAVRATYGSTDVREGIVYIGGWIDDASGGSTYSDYTLNLYTRNQFDDPVTFTDAKAFEYKFNDGYVFARIQAEDYAGGNINPLWEIGDVESENTTYAWRVNFGNYAEFSSRHLGVTAFKVTPSSVEVNTPLALTDDIDMNASGKIIDLLDPTDPQDAATKSYVDSQSSLQGLQSVIDTGRTWVSGNGVEQFSLLEGNDSAVGEINFNNTAVNWGYNLTADEGLSFKNVSGVTSSIYKANSGFQITGGSIQLEYIDTDPSGYVYIQEKFGNAFTVANRKIWDNPGGQGIQTTFSSNAPGGTLHWQYQNDFAWSVNDTEEVLRIKGDVNGTGKVGIKTTNPQKELDVNGDVKVRGDLDLTGNIFFEQTGGTNIRALIGTTNTSPNCDIEIGQTGTSIIEGINLKPGDAGGIVDIYNNTSVAARFKSAKLAIGDQLNTANTINKAFEIQDNDPWIRLENSLGRRLDTWIDSTTSYISATGASNNLNFKTAGSDRLHIANDGSIGIGTTNPGSIVEIVEPTNKAELKLTVLSDEDTAVSFENPSRTFKVGYDTSKDVFKIANSSFNSKNFTIAPDGNCGIGTDEPSRDLHISSSTAAIELENTSQSDCFINFKNPGRTFKVGYDDSSDVWKVAKSTFGNNALTINGDDGRVGLGTQTTDASAILELDSDEQGFLMPRLTTPEINAISSPATGLAVYNISINTICFYNGTSWQKVNHANM